MTNPPFPKPAAAGHINDVTFPDLAAEVVGSVAPHEMELLPEVTAAWLDGGVVRSRAWQRLGGSVEFGVGPDLLCSVVYPILTGAFAQVFGTAALEWRAQHRRWWRRRRHTPRPEVPPLRTDQAEAVRAACLDHAQAAGMSTPRAALLADAVYARLLRGTASADGDP